MSRKSGLPLFPVYVYPHGALQFLWTSLVSRQIVIDVGNMPQCFIPDIRGHHSLYCFLHEGQ